LARLFPSAPLFGHNDTPVPMGAGRDEQEATLGRFNLGIADPNLAVLPPVL
jgi:hypothetical protein